MKIQGLIDDQQQLLEKATAELAEFDSLPAMLSYEAQRKQIYEDLRRLDTQNAELLKQRNDLLALRTRAEMVLEDLRQVYQRDINRL